MASKTTAGHGHKGCHVVPTFYGDTAILSRPPLPKSFIGGITKKRKTRDKNDDLAAQSTIETAEAH